MSSDGQYGQDGQVYRGGPPLNLGWLARWGRVLLPLLIGAVAIGGTMIRGCQQGPFGRRQVVAIDPAQEERLGAQAFGEVLQKSEILRDGPVVEAVNRIAKRLVAATTNPNVLAKAQLPEQRLAWEVRVVRSDEVNAFCLPGGKIVVYTGILPVAKTEAGLATVMGHEIAHALGHHGAERMAQTQIAQIGLAAASGSMGDMDPANRRQMMAILNTGAKFGILKYSREHESEADHLGLLLMAAAGYDPAEAMAFWERMAAASGGKAPPEFASTHPSHATRIGDLRGWQAEAAPLFQASGGGDNRPLPVVR